MRIFFVEKYVIARDATLFEKDAQARDRRNFEDLKHAARGGKSSRPDPVLNIVTKHVLKSPIKIFLKNKKKKKKKF